VKTGERDAGSSERGCLEHFRQARELGTRFAEYCRSQGLKANEWHAVRHGMVSKGLPPGRARNGGSKKRPSRNRRSNFIPVRVESGGGEVSPLWPAECVTLRDG
jgi:hypothetical protein